jgi:putative methyltransferase (TIGR04325 family)
MLHKYLQPQRYARRLRAMAASLARPITDYEAEAITNFVYQKTLAFNRTTALDFDMGSERLLLGVGMASAGNTPDVPCRVLDFGGACGAQYKLATLLFDELPIRWAVVETHSMVRKARALETQSLRFFEDIPSATTWLGSVDLVHSNSALQYLTDPLQTVRQLLDLSPKIALWERLMLSDGPTRADKQRTMLFNHGPGAVPEGFRNRPVLNDIVRLSSADFLAAHEGRFRLRGRANDAGYPTYLFSRRT